MKGKNNITGSKGFLDYLGRKLSLRERNAFEREINRDPFAEEALEGLEGSDPESFERDLAVLERRIRAKSSSGKSSVVWRIAASILLVAAVGTVIYVSTGIKREPGQTAAVSPLEADSAVAAGKTEKPVADLSEKERRTVSEKKVTAETKDSEVNKSAVTEAAAPERTDEQTDQVLNFEIKEEETPGKVSAKEQARPAALATVQEPTLSGRRAEDSLHGMITGVVISSEDKLPVPGVSIRIKGTNTGTLTDVNGFFSLPASQAADRDLIANFIGMESAEFKIGEGKSKEVILKPSELALEEVVVVGYGTAKKAVTAGGAVSRIEFEDKTPDDKYTPPEPDGGKEAFQEYVANALVNPASLVEGERAIVVVAFNVFPDGTTDSLKVIRSRGEEYSNEALRVLKNGPGWKPATLNGIRIKEEVKIRFVFR